MKGKVPQSCPTLCDPMDCTVHGILQARILEWVAFPFSRGSSQPRDRTQVSRIVVILYQLGHKGSPRILERVAYPFSHRSSRPRNQTGVSSCRQILYQLSIREAHFSYKVIINYWLYSLCCSLHPCNIYFIASSLCLLFPFTCLALPPPTWLPLVTPMAPHSSILAWKIPWMEKSGGLQSMGSLRVRHD